MHELCKVNEVKLFYKEALPLFGIVRMEPFEIC